MVLAVTELGWTPEEFYRQSLRDVVVLLDASASRG